MKISVTGKQVKVGSALQEYVKDELSSTVNKYFEHAVSADVVFSKERNFFRTDIIVNEGTGSHIVIKSQGRADDAHASFDKAAEKITRQLRRYKGKIKDHAKVRPTKDMDSIPLEVKKFVLESKEEEAVSHDDAPLIVAEQTTAIEYMTVGQAVERMDLMDLPTLLFINKLTNSVCVVYYRQDGNISWIDSGVQADSADTKKKA